MRKQPHGAKRSNVSHGTATVGPEDVTYPIPQRQIDLSHGNLVQNR